MRIKIQKNIGCSFLTIALVLTAPFKGAYALRWGDADIKPTFSSGLRFDSNITNEHADRISDSIATLTPGLSLVLEGKEKTLKTTASLTKEHYFSETAFDNVSEKVGLNYNQDLSKWSRIQLAGSFLHASTPETFSEQFGRGPGRFPFNASNWDFEYNRDISNRLTMKAGFNNEIYRRGSGGVDTMSNGMTVEGRYAISSATILVGRAGYSRREYDPGDSLSTQMIDIGVFQYFTKQLYLEVYAGLGRVTGNGTQTDPRYKMALTNEFDELTRAVLTFYSSTGSNNYNTSVFSSWRVSFDMVRRLLARLSVTAGLFYGNGKYSGEDPIEDKLTGVNIRFDFEPTKDMTVFLGHKYTATDSSQISRTTSRNLMEFGLTFKF